MNFVRLYEYNDHEGESWVWWLQLDGNEQEMMKLDVLLEEALEDDPDPWYELDIWETEPQSVVDKLVEYAGSGYYAPHNKVVGKFTCPEDLGEHADKLYKGGIKDFFEESQ